MSHKLDIFQRHRLAKGYVHIAVHALKKVKEQGHAAACVYYDKKADLTDCNCHISTIDEALSLIYAGQANETNI